MSFDIQLILLSPLPKSNSFWVSQFPKFRSFCMSPFPKSSSFWVSLLPGTTKARPKKRGHAKRDGLWKREHPKTAGYQIIFFAIFYLIQNFKPFFGKFLCPIFYRCAKSAGDCDTFPLVLDNGDKKTDM